MFVIIFGIVIITADESLMNINLMYLFLLVLCLILRCFWGYSFENLASENSIDEDGSGIDANVEYCSVIKTKLGAHRIVMVLRWTAVIQPTMVGGSMWTVLCGVENKQRGRSSFP